MEPRVVKRQLSNFLIYPLLQTKIGLYFIGLSLLFALTLGIIFYMNLNHLFAFVIDMTEAPDEIKKILITYLQSLQTWIYLTLAGYMILIIAISVWYTHRLVGPMVAFRRHFEALDSGDFEHRTILRKSDAFHDAAQVLNQATESLGKRFKV